MPGKLALLTAGGHISSFHAGIFGVLKKAEELGYEVIGFIDGYIGANEGRYVKLNSSLIEVDKAGSVLGCSREKADIDKIKKNMKKLKVDALITMGGDDTLGDAAKLHKAGVKVVGWPKTMDNDLSATYFCFGYPTAVERAAEFVRQAHYDAITNQRINIITMFGRDTDWIVAAAGAWGLADLIVPAEQEYEIGEIFQRAKNVFEENGRRYNRRFAVVAVAEGAKINGLESHLREDEIDPRGHPKIEPMKLALVLKDAFKELKEKKVAIDSISYGMRNCRPTEVDAKYAEFTGGLCVEMIKYGKFGLSPVLRTDNEIYVSEAPLSEVSVQRFLRPEGFIDYENLRVNQGFVDYYRLLFGEPPDKEDVIYRSMISN